MRHCALTCWFWRGKSLAMATAAGAGSSARSATDATQPRVGNGLHRGRASTGRMGRLLNVVDAYTRECLAPEADMSLGSAV